MSTKILFCQLPCLKEFSRNSAVTHSHIIMTKSESVSTLSIKTSRQVSLIRIPRKVKNTSTQMIVAKIIFDLTTFLEKLVEQKKKNAKQLFSSFSVFFD